ncbi:MAG: hypothetical protein R3227_03170 [Reinekea sp.]|nr:hypothetical protein [Reinekea sp.]
MLIALGYGIISTLLLYVGYQWLTARYPKRVLTHTLPLSVLNALLAIVFTILYLVSPQTFSAETQISGIAPLVFFTILSLYFYLLIIPLEGLNLVLLYQEKARFTRAPGLSQLCLSMIAIAGVIYISVSVF